MDSPISIVMLGTGDFALPSFEGLADAGFRMLTLVTQPDRPQGRRQELIPSLVKQAAERRGVPVFQPERVNDAEAVEHLRELAPDFLITAAYGQILSAELLGVPSQGALNLHGSILPAYRGAAPVARAIQNGDLESGVTIIQMTPRVDAGGMIAVARTPIEPDETAGELEDRLAKLGVPLLIDAVRAVASGRAEILPQDPALVTKAPKLRKDDGLIDWTRSARQIHDLVRAMQPWPIASTTWTALPWTPKGPVRLIVHKVIPVEGNGEPGTVLAASKDGLVVAAGEGAVQLLVVQAPGKRALSAAEFLRGHHVQVNDKMGE
ncbi:methionyl-tRNA formyltransferase [Planctomyces sp. SH-PL62]|uniref:methionyl-tRNA formyltransferase n=1 Tax=Planctomyces sp. SH-PL62 TaxID=1636152 RepID=UPI00078D0CE0|nr:methionyl-tRNA formyltransferase [Planctomyces sp. SH-PL62]AMV38928.1 Methionyl-tRNA formyltransferase [Planctomyces sp. SH-PL62]